jgi:hypothetical protein
MTNSLEELRVKYHNLARIVFEQDKQLDELIKQIANKNHKKSSRYFVQEKERMELFLRKKNLMEEYTDFKNQLRDSSKSKG